MNIVIAWQTSSESNVPNQRLSVRSVKTTCHALRGYAPVATVTTKNTRSKCELTESRKNPRHVSTKRVRLVLKSVYMAVPFRRGN